MTTADHQLQALLGELAGMPRDHRTAVLDTLDQAERDALHRVLSDSKESSLSPALAKLIEDCRSGLQRPEITERAAEALTAAVDDSMGEAPIEDMLERLKPQQSLVSRLFRRKARAA